eukprot:comp21444_c0_seq1/m.29611 comp21444_c0_seq1/g.29611  ORF comp21444_c0_seq1/g.29611 comp21444_c0_seq1/m.29611 type:complete len:347 (-) comp21444_c0_seq1:477-1517(-)
MAAMLDEEFEENDSMDASEDETPAVIPVSVPAPMDPLGESSMDAAPPSRSHVIESPIPDICKEEACCLGIDEAGRGPVLGPMVYATAFCPVFKKTDLKALGFADSKKLDEAQRDRLYDVIKDNKDYVGYNVHVLSPQEISGAMLRKKKYNLNALSHDTAIGLVRRVLAHGVKLTEIYVDTVGDAKKYQAKLAEIFPGIKVVVESKADDTYPIVSAASICAKVTRDLEVRSWRFEEQDMGDVSRVFGSGYPGDPSTKAWLNKTMDPIFGFPSLVRFSWGTAKKLMEEKCLSVDWGDEDASDEEEGDGQSKAAAAASADFMQNFLRGKNAPQAHRFFAERKITVVNDF